jgi:prophage lambdaWp4, DNA methylase|nr:MAG TPA: ParB protein [Caudoviricetes sp.]
METPTETNKLTQIKLSKIQPYWRNPRDNNDEAVQKVMESIETYGYQVPIIVDKDNVIIAGHTRFKALQRLNSDKDGKLYKSFDTIAVIVSEMDKKKAKEFRVVDNKTSEYSNWDIDNLTLELKEFIDPLTVQSFFPEINLEAGFKDLDFEITDEQVEKKEKELEEQFEKKSEERQDATLEIMCPHCLETFEMSRKDILTNRHLEKGF